MSGGQPEHCRACSENQNLQSDLQSENHHTGSMKGLKAHEELQEVYGKAAQTVGTEGRMVMSESDEKINRNSYSGD